MSLSWSSAIMLIVFYLVGHHHGSRSERQRLRVRLYAAWRRWRDHNPRLAPPYSELEDCFKRDTYQEWVARMDGEFHRRFGGKKWE